MNKDPRRCEHIWRESSWISQEGWNMRYCELCGCLTPAYNAEPVDIEWAEEALKEEPNKGSP